MAGHHAVHVQREGAGPVVMIDSEPQGSVSDEWNERHEHLGVKMP